MNLGLGLGLFLRAFARSGLVGNLLTGAGTPSAGTGSDGDFYFDTSNCLDFYGPKAAGAWPAAVNLIPSAADGNQLVGSGGRYKGERPREWYSRDNGWLGESLPLVTAAFAGNMGVAGTVQLAKIWVPEACNITGVGLYVNSAGSGLTSGQCFAAVYQSNALIGTTADQAVAWASTGMKKMALAGGPFAVAAGNVDIAWFFNGTTSPGTLRSLATATTDSFNQGLATTAIRSSSADAGRTTTMPATLGARTAAAAVPWAAIY